MINPEIRRLVRLQGMLTACAVLVSAVLSHNRLSAVLSALIGGSSVIIPALVYARIAYKRRRAAPAELLKAHFAAEAVKFLLTISMFGAAFAFFKDLSVAALFGGYIAAVSAYWFKLLVKN
ncbi:ATP synthase subunit I [Crenobacter sp. SG2303]|uniref:ATP synthase subunit I n=1 Tax=Crenobacter oryzisoli TaxID=3056844 RepID=A0ABT7XM05_9NEIS|nr:MULTISPECIES: ATP synthase subunit I [unclassified Crenobacter]MDN0074634.1 ATP synthase subunit I [Crenobacter sp. SG2303]MDN0084345.1 ATP synthase subunit I [Crenobacter sp. SG2305]